jgi:cysteine-rich repeat protein
VNPGELPFRIELGSQQAPNVVFTASEPGTDYVDILPVDIETAACHGIRYFQTVRIPLAEYEAAGVDLERIVQITFQIDPGVESEFIAIDSVEFVRNPDLCGNDQIDIDEECDGNDLGGATCADLGQQGGQLTCASDCTFDVSQCATCGNGVVEGSEECDDGNGVDEDSCTSACLLNICGDGFLNAEVEECDDGNASDGDGCSASCEKECGPGDDGSVFCPCLPLDTCGEEFLACKFRDEDADEKECLPCDLGGGIGWGCPCNSPGASCEPDEFDIANEDCWKHPEDQWTCLGPVPGWEPFGIPRCFDFNPDFQDLGMCEFGSGQNQCPNALPEPQICVGNLCEDNECGEDNGVAIGICRAANMLCNQMVSLCEPGECEWPTIDGDPPPSCSHGLAWCTQP